MKKFFLILSLIALLVFSSCEFGTPEAEKSYYKGAIEIGTSSSSLTRSLENQYKKEFENGDMISVFVYQEGKTDPVADNAILKYDGTGAWTEVVYREAVDEQEQAAGYFEASEEEKKMAWTGDEGTYTFIATYPAITNDIEIKDGKVSFDLYNNPTQLFAEIIKDKAAPTTAEEAKVTLTLDPLLGGVQTMSDLASGMKISAYTAFTFDVTSGGVETVGSKKSLSFSTKDEDGYYCSPLLIPQEITISGNEFSNTLGITAGNIITIEKETKVESISLDKASLDLPFNGNSVETYDLNPTYTPTDAYTKNAVWTSSDERVATVADGVVTIVGPGSATITLSVGEVSAECQVNVTGIKFGSGVSYSVSEKEYTVTGTYATLTEPLVTVCGDGYTIKLNGITVGSESSRVTQPIVRVMGGTLTIKLSETNTVPNTVYTTGAGSDKKYSAQQSNSVINLVGKDANVVIEGSLTSNTAKTLSDDIAADLVINEYLSYTGSQLSYGHDALIGGSSGDIIGDITIKNAKINFVYATGKYISSAMIGSGSNLSDNSIDELGSTGKLTVENSVIDVTTTSLNEKDPIYVNGAVIGSGKYANCGDININGSKITVKFGDTKFSVGSAVIGSGASVSTLKSKLTAPDITVTKSIISAKYDAKLSKCETNNGALIGSGQTNKVGNIVVSASELTVDYLVPFEGTIIGTGNIPSESKGTITVNSTDITVNAGGYSINGSIIGSGYSSASEQKRGDISVSGGTITLTNIDAIKGSVIGVGPSYDNQNSCSVGNITVEEGTNISIETIAGNTSGGGVVIGAGADGSHCGEITIRNLGSISIKTDTSLTSPVGRIIGSCSSGYSYVNGDISIYLSKEDTSVPAFLNRIKGGGNIAIVKDDIGGKFTNNYSVKWFDSNGNQITN